jgi:hypothetical protein
VAKRVLAAKVKVEDRAPETPIARARAASAVVASGSMSLKK